MEDLLQQETHFAFGKNWLDYARGIREQDITQAMMNLQRVNRGERLDGKTFLDIGCGSGVHALAAIRLGAKRVSCVDIDPDSVQATQQTLARFAPSVPADVRMVSVFDMRPETHGVFDVVYSWGVLHHTGDMYQAITRAAALVDKQGIFIIALYKKTPFCGMWRGIKKRYSSASPSSQKRMRSVYLLLKENYGRLRGVDIDSLIANYSRERGMNYYNDVHDWMGGFPYESISPEECTEFFRKLAFDLVFSNLMREYGTRGFFGTGCDEYTFARAN